MPYDFDHADTLIFSDDPEALSTVMRPGDPIHVTTPTDAILYEAEVGGGRKRVFYYHQNFDPAARTLAVRIENIDAAPVTLRVLEYAQEVEGDIVSVGHRSIVGFLRKLIAGSWTTVNLQAAGGPGGETTVARSVKAAGQLASAFVEMDTPAASRLRVRVISAASAATLDGVGRNGEGQTTGDGIGRSGVFDLTRSRTAQGDFAALAWDVNAAPLQIAVPDPRSFPNAKVPATSPGHNPQAAVYGVFTRRTVTLSNTGASDVDVGVYVQADGGDSPATCMVDDEIIELGTMTSGPRATRPAYEMATRTVGAHTNGSVTIDLLGTVDPSGRGPLTIIVAKRGTLPPPDPRKQVVFLPGGAPWTA